MNLDVHINQTILCKTVKKNLQLGEGGQCVVEEAEEMYRVECNNSRY